MAADVNQVNGGMWDHDKETRQSGSNAAYDRVESRWKHNITPSSQSTTLVDACIL